MRGRAGDFHTVARPSPWCVVRRRLRAFQTGGAVLQRGRAAFQRGRVVPPASVCRPPSPPCVFPKWQGVRAAAPRHHVPPPIRLEAVHMPQPNAAYELAMPQPNASYELLSCSCISAAYELHTVAHEQPMSYLSAAMSGVVAWVGGSQ